MFVELVVFHNLARLAGQPCSSGLPRSEGIHQVAPFHPARCFLQEQAVAKLLQVLHRRLFGG